MDALIRTLGAPRSSSSSDLMNRTRETHPSDEEVERFADVLDRVAERSSGTMRNEKVEKPKKPKKPNEQIDPKPVRDVAGDKVEKPKKPNEQVDPKPVRDVAGDKMKGGAPESKEARHTSEEVSLSADGDRTPEVDGDADIASVDLSAVDDGIVDGAVVEFVDSVPGVTVIDPTLVVVALASSLSSVHGQGTITDGATDGTPVTLPTVVLGPEDFVLPVARQNAGPGDGVGGFALPQGVISPDMASSVQMPVVSAPPAPNVPSGGTAQAAVAVPIGDVPAAPPAPNATVTTDLVAHSVMTFGSTDPVSVEIDVVEAALDVSGIAPGSSVLSEQSSDAILVASAASALPLKSSDPLVTQPAKTPAVRLDGEKEDLSIDPDVDLGNELSAIPKSVLVQVSRDGFKDVLATVSPEFVVENDAGSPANGGNATPLTPAVDVRPKIAVHGAAYIEMSPRQELQPARQVVVGVVKAIADGRQEIRIEMRPAELGTVEVRLEFTDNKVNAVIRAERQETLDLLQRDQRSFERAFKDSGLEFGDNGLRFALGGGRDGDGGRGEGPGRSAGRGSETDGGGDVNAPTATRSWNIDSGVFDIVV
jgi:hypothetical protein